MDTAWLVERRHDEFVASYAVQHWLDVTARRKTVAITLRDLEPFDKRLAPLSRPMSRHLPGRESPDCGRLSGTGAVNLHQYRSL